MGAVHARGMQVPTAIFGRLQETLAGARPQCIICNDSAVGMAVQREWLMDYVGCAGLGERRRLRPTRFSTDSPEEKGGYEHVLATP